MYLRFKVSATSAGNPKVGCQIDAQSGVRFSLLAHEEPGSVMELVYVLRLERKF